MGKRLKLSADKRVEEEEDEDRLSSLPLLLHHHILSFLPIQQVVQTCLLSKTWEDIWSSVPCINIDENTFEHRQAFDQFTELLLLQRDPSWNIQSFHLSTKIRTYGCKRRFNAWVLYAVRRNVEVLSLTKANGVTSRVLTCMSLRELQVTDATIHLPGSICLPALKKLHLRKVDVDNKHELEDLLYSVMSTLEELVLYKCDFSNFSLVSGPQLKTLRLVGNFPRSTLIISAPNLVSLELEPKEAIERIKIKTTLDHLVDAKFTMQASCFKSTRQICKIFRKTRSLKLYWPFIRSLTKELDRERHILKYFDNLRCLEIETFFTVKEFSGINSILEQSPQIESLLLNNVGEEEDETPHAIEKVCKFKLPCLRVLEITGFEGYQIEINLIKFFLENATVLEKLTIRYNTTGDIKKISESCSKLCFIDVSEDVKGEENSVVKLREGSSECPL